MLVHNIKKTIKSSAPQLYLLIKGVANNLGIIGLSFTKKVSGEDFFIDPDFSKNQYFFTKKTAKYLVTLFGNHKKICCLCTPRLAFEWCERGEVVTLLDIDEQFKFIPGYQYYDLKHPTDLKKQFDLIIVDPPFSLPAQEIRKAIDVLVSQSLNITLCMCFPLEREKELFAAFSGWNLRRILLENLKWNNIKESYQNNYGFYGNRPIHLTKEKAK